MNSKSLGRKERNEKKSDKKYKKMLEGKKRKNGLKSPQFKRMVHQINKQGNK